MSDTDSLARRILGHAIAIAIANAARVVSAPARADSGPP
jgi:hypothetical protein